MNFAVLTVVVRSPADDLAELALMAGRLELPLLLSLADLYFGAPGLGRWPFAVSPGRARRRTRARQPGGDRRHPSCGAGRGIGATAGLGIVANAALPGVFRLALPAPVARRIER